jgi:phosphoglycerate dehydrogenase-like enzyme
VVDEKALYDALTKKRIDGAVLDTWWQYPTSYPAPNPQPSSLPLLQLDNVVATPHCSGWTEEARQRRYQGCTDNLRQFFANRCIADGLNHIVERHYWNTEPFPKKDFLSNS